MLTAPGFLSVSCKSQDHERNFSLRHGDGDSVSGLFWPASVPFQGGEERVAGLRDRLRLQG